MEKKGKQRSKSGPGKEWKKLKKKIRRKVKDGRKLNKEGSERK